MAKDEFEKLEDRITFAQAELPLGHPLESLYRFHSAAVTKTTEFIGRYQSNEESDLEALRKYAYDLENSVEALS